MIYNLNDALEIIENAGDYMPLAFSDDGKYYLRLLPLGEYGAETYETTEAVYDGLKKRGW